MYQVLFIFLPILMLWTNALLLGRRVDLCEGRKSNQICLLVLVALPVLAYSFVLVGLRPETAGGDTPRYLHAYRQLGSPLDAMKAGASYFGNTELLWWPIQSLVKPFLSGEAWLAVNFLVVFFLVFLGYRVACRSYRLNHYLFAFVFMTFFLVYSGNIMRQALSIPIGAIAFFSFFQRRYAHWAVLSLLAIGLHWSSLVLLVAPVFLLGIFKKDWIYLTLPSLALGGSVFASDLVGGLVGLIGYEGLARKYDLYFAAGHESHVGQVWLTANFWLCTVFSLLFLALCRPSKYEDRSLHAYVLLHLFLVMLGVRVPDFSERYFPAILFVLPLLVALLLRRTNLPAGARNGVLLAFFFAMGMLVFLTPSSQLTLGYTLS